MIVHIPINMNKRCNFYTG